MSFIKSYTALAQPLGFSITLKCADFGMSAKVWNFAVGKSFNFE